MRKRFIFFQMVVLILVAATALAQEWSGPKFDARLGDPYSQGWLPDNCKHVQYDANGVLVENGADQIKPFGCYDGEGTTPTLSPEFMSMKKAYGIDVLHVDYRVYSLPTWQSLTDCSQLNEFSGQMKTEARAHHNYQQSFIAPFDDADDEWEGFTLVWMARVEDLPGCLGMRVKAGVGINAGAVEGDLSAIEARYGCVDPDDDIFGPDNLVIRSGPDPATGHDYVNTFSDEDGSEKWHIFRITMEVGATPDDSRAKIYIDENSEPVIITSGVQSRGGSKGNWLQWGVGGWNCPKVASMAYVLSTTEGAYGPAELALPSEFQEIFATARSFQDDAFVHVENWEGPLFDARYGDPYSQGWVADNCKHQELDFATGELKDNGADSLQAFGCYGPGQPALSPEFMSVAEEDAITSLQVDYRVYTLPTWQSLTDCSQLNEFSGQMKTEARAHHNYQQSFIAPFDDADDEWEGFTLVWMARVEDLPGCLGMRVKAGVGINAGAVEGDLSAIEARYGCVDPDDDIFGPDNLVIRSGPDPATGHDYVNTFSDEDGSEKWHIFRITMEVGATPDDSRAKIYIDENSEPVIITSGVQSRGGSKGNWLQWGVGGWNCPKVASMAYVLSTTEGAFGPAERPLPQDYTDIYNTARANWSPLSVYEIEKEEGAVPQNFALDQNYPNPFNPSTTIRYHLNQQTNVVLAIFDITGQYITSLVNNKEQEAGTFTVTWDGKDLYGNQMSTGAYFFMLKTSEFQETKKMILLK